MSIDLLTQFQEFVQHKQLISPKDSVAVAVSGGLDSMVLLHLLDRLRSPWQLTLLILHVNHHLRGTAADQDEQFVQHAAEAYGLPLDVEHVHVKTWATKHSMSIETAARELRYAWFERVAKAHECCVATAHTASDQAETVLANLMRGSGIRGLRGIPVQRGPFIRPLLFAERSELQHYAQEHDISYHTDHTNVDETFQRNRIRHTLIPIMRDQFNPQIVLTLNRLATAADESERLLQDYGEIALKKCTRRSDETKIALDIQQFLTYLKSLQRLVLGHVFQQLVGRVWQPGYHEFNNLLQFITKQHSGSQIRLTDDVVLTISQDDMVFHRSVPVFADQEIPWQPGTYKIQDGLFLEIKTETQPLPLRSAGKTTEYVDADRVHEPVRLTSAQPGDAFYPINGRGRKNVAEFFIDSKVHVYERPRIPILRCNTGIVWICGYRLDDRFKITETTTHIYKLKMLIL